MDSKSKERKGIYMKVHHSEGKKIVAICDEELIGRVLEEDDVVMDLDTYRQFYVGEICEPERIKKELEEFSSINAVGKRSTDLLLSTGIATSESILTIENVPYLQIYKV